MCDFIGYFTSRGINSPDSYHAITPVRVDICPPIVSVEETQSAQEFQLFFLIFSMEGNQTSVIESSDGDIKKLIARAVPESTKKVTTIRCQ